MRRSKRANSLVIWLAAIDLKGNLKGILILFTISIFFCGVYFCSDIAHAIKIKKYKGEVVGHLISYKENKHQSQSRTGSKIKTLNYELEYSFNVNGKNYHVKTTLNYIILPKIRTPI